MAAVSYVITAGGVLETVTTGTAAPTSGMVEIRMDQTTTSVTEGAGTRAPKKGEIYQAIQILLQYLERDINITQ